MKIMINENEKLSVRDQADYLANELLSRVPCEVYEAVENLTRGDKVMVSDNTDVSPLSDILYFEKQINLPGFRMDVTICTDKHYPTMSFRKQHKDWIDDIDSDCPHWERLQLMGRDCYAPPLVVIDLLMAQAQAELVVTFLGHSDWQQTINNLSVLRAAVEESENV